MQSQCPDKIIEHSGREFRRSPIGRVRNGDIVVCNSTDPGWTSVFPKILALVLKTGGMLARGACLSREYGIPAVQARDATQIAVDGNTARVCPALAG